MELHLYIKNKENECSRAYHLLNREFSRELRLHIIDHMIVRGKRLPRWLVSVPSLLIVDKRNKTANLYGDDQVFGKIHEMIRSKRVELSRDSPIEAPPLRTSGRPGRTGPMARTGPTTRGRQERGGRPQKTGNKAQGQIDYELIEHMLMEEKDTTRDEIDIDLSIRQDARLETGRPFDGHGPLTKTHFPISRSKLPAFSGGVSREICRDAGRQVPRRSR